MCMYMPSGSLCRSSREARRGTLTSSRAAAGAHRQRRTLRGRVRQTHGNTLKQHRANYSLLVAPCKRQPLSASPSNNAAVPGTDPLRPSQGRQF